MNQETLLLARKVYPNGTAKTIAEFLRSLAKNPDHPLISLALLASAQEVEEMSGILSEIAQRQLDI